MLKVIIVGEKGRNLTQSYDKNGLTAIPWENLKKAKPPPPLLLNNDCKNQNA